MHSFLLRANVINLQVSIPFKRESVSELSLQRFKFNIRITFQFPSNGKAYLNWTKTANNLRFFESLFQFPSNGKAYLNPTLPKNTDAHLIFRFQFPSNGKAYLNGNEIGVDKDKYIVSIPFKRESVSELMRNLTTS